MTNKILFAALLLLSGCVSRQTYLRDRLQDSQDKQEQRKFNAEVLRKLEEMKKPCDCGKATWDFEKVLDEVEKKMDERKPDGVTTPVNKERSKEPCTQVLMSNPPKCREQERPNGPEHFSNSVDTGIVRGVEQEYRERFQRPNYPCPYCDGSAPKP